MTSYCLLRSQKSAMSTPSRQAFDVGAHHKSGWALRVAYCKQFMVWGGRELTPDFWPPSGQYEAGGFRPRPRPD